MLNTTPRRVSPLAKKEQIMLTIVMLLLALVLFDLIAMRRGIDSTDGVNSCEWERRQHWGEKLDEQIEVC